MAHTISDNDMNRAAGEALRSAPPEMRKAVYESARRRHRIAWRNLIAGSAVLVVAIAATVWVAALI